MRYVLLLQGRSASAFAMGRTGFSAAVVFNNDPSGQHKFSSYVAERRHSLFSIVVDSKDEEHHLDSIPQLKRRDRTRLLKKITARHFSDTTLSAIAVESDRQADACAITSSGLPPNNDCQVWLQLLDDNSVLMTDISSLALLGMAIHKVSANPLSLCALQLAQNDFRIMAYHKARLIISRHLTVTDDLAAELINQLQQTWDYLNRLPLGSAAGGTRAAGDTLQVNDSRIFKCVQVIGALPADSRARLERAGATVTSCRVMSRTLGIKPELSVPFADMLFAALALSRRSKQARFSMGEYKNHYLARRLRHVLCAGSIACFGVTAAATAAAVHINATYMSLIATSRGLSSDVQMPVLLKSVVHSGVDYPIDAIRDSMRIAEHISARTQFTPLHFLSSLATNLTVYPELEVSAIQWSRTDDDQGQFLSQMAQQAIGSDSRIYYTATITGYLQMQPSERVVALQRFNSFVAALTATDQTVSVTVVEAPFSMADSLAVSTDKQLMADSLPSLKEPFTIEFATRQVVQ